MIRLIIALLALVSLAGATLRTSARAAETAGQTGVGAMQSGYVDVDGLQVYYEVHGHAAGTPLVLLHGGLTTIDISFGVLIPQLSRQRQVIAIEQQGHGHTADMDRPFSYEQMADDTAAVLTHLGVAQADFFGWSDGGNVALQMGLRHPTLVRRIIALGASIDNLDALGPEVLAWFAQAKPEDFGPQLPAAYAAVAPDPGHWPDFIRKYVQWQVDCASVPDAALAAIDKPVLIMAGDRGGDRPEHAVRIFRALPQARIAVLPGTTHFAMHERGDWILAIVEDYLNSDLAEPQPGAM
jgi:pimeloyl-ACP methyl ester carboxylesterase